MQLLKQMRYITKVNRNKEQDKIQLLKQMI